jgi:hypothetical protein
MARAIYHHRTSAGLFGAGVLGIEDKTAEDAMTKLDSVFMLEEVCSTQRATVQHATHNVHHAACSVEHSTSMRAQHNMPQRRAIRAGSAARHGDDG